MDPAVRPPFPPLTPGIPGLNVRLPMADHTVKKVFVSDAVSEKGVAQLAASEGIEVTFQTGLSEDDLCSRIPGHSALIVRSQTKVTERVMDAAGCLEVIGRAGVGVDNVDIEAATKRGIVVMNTPGGNTVSTAEHAFSLMVSTARRIPQAHASMVAGRWDRKKFQGVEIFNKCLAILGMGRIGTEFARRAIAFGMRVLAYDPYLSASRARSLQVELLEDLDEVVAQADFITLHMPLTAETRHMIDRRRIGLMRPGVRIVNCARGGLIDEDALLEALDSGQVAGAALDVYEEEPPPADSPLRKNPNLVMTPHLGASTAEAQEGVGIEIAEAVREALLHGTIRNAVNAPSVDAKTLEQVGPFIDLGESLGRFLSQISPTRCDSLEISFIGRLAGLDTTPVSRSILKGFLEQAGGSDVNVVNAPGLAETLGIRVRESRQSKDGDFKELIELTATSEGAETSVAGTFFGPKPRIVMVNGRHIEARPKGVLFLLENTDRPGIVGHIGTIFGKNEVNIAAMSLSRSQQGGRALTVLNLDSVPDQPLLDELAADDDIHWHRVITL